METRPAGETRLDPEGELTIVEPTLDDADRVLAVGSVAGVRLLGEDVLATLYRVPVLDLSTVLALAVSCGKESVLVAVPVVAVQLSNPLSKATVACAQAHAQAVRSSRGNSYIA